MKRKLNVISESWWVLCNQDWRVGETGGRRRRRNRRGVHSALIFPTLGHSKVLQQQRVGSLEFLLKQHLVIKIRLEN